MKKRSPFHSRRTVWSHTRSVELSDNEQIRRGSGWIGLDIGGANIKTAHENGHARTVPFEVWKRPDELGEAIAAQWRPCRRATGPR